MLERSNRWQCSASTAGLGVRTAGAGTVLIIESSQEVAEVIGELVEAAGRRALACTGARAGLEALRRSVGAVDLVLLDTSLRHFRYLSVAEQIWQIRPGLPVALCSGGCEPHRLRSTLPDQHFVRLLRKPFRSRELTGLLDELGVASR